MTSDTKTKYRHDDLCADHNCTDLEEIEGEGVPINCAEQPEDRILYRLLYNVEILNCR